MKGEKKCERLREKIATFISLYHFGKGRGGEKDRKQNKDEKPNHASFLYPLLSKKKKEKERKKREKGGNWRGTKLCLPHPFLREKREGKKGRG